MAILNPCCCISLRTGAKIVSIIDIIVALIFLIIFLVDLTWTISDSGNPTNPIPLKQPSTTQATSQTTKIGITDADDDCCDDPSCEDEQLAHSLESVTKSSYVTSGVWTILTVFLATNIGISALLWTGSRNYSIKRCKWWFYIQTVITSVAVVVLILIICFQVSFAYVVLDFFHLIYRFYTLWVVYLFIGELTYLDTLCSLNSHKKGTGAGIMYPTSMYTNSAPYVTNHYPYSENQYHQQQYADPGHDTVIPGSSPIHYHSSDDGLPHNGGTGGGIDNPTYLP